jgi:hypothetical protein
VRKQNNEERDPRKWLTKKIILNVALPVLQHPLAEDLGTKAAIFQGLIVSFAALSL